MWQRGHVTGSPIPGGRTAGARHNRVMGTRIEDYALVSNARTASLISRTGEVDWWCAPRFDSASIFGALLGGADQGRWSLRPTDPDAVATRHYDGDTFVLVTRWTTARGVAEVIDALPIGADTTVLRRVRGVSGSVGFGTEVRFRFDYARAIPWVSQVGTEEEPVLRALAGPDTVELRGLRLRGDDHRHVGEFTVEEGATRDLTLTWWPSHLNRPGPLDVDRALETTRRWWQDWADHIRQEGHHIAGVVRSLLVLRALTDRTTGGIVAAATTSLPEAIGGLRNWDYRYVWLRDAALTLEVLISHGFIGTAHHWRDWLLRAVAGDPAQVQIMYGAAGERDLPERELASLPGYEGSRPVRIGNGAVDQYQGDVIGEVLMALEAARAAGLRETPTSWALQRALLGEVIERMDRPDQGMWEMRGGPQRFTHSRVMIWAAFDSAVRAVTNHDLPGDAEKWTRLRDAMRAEIEASGYDAERGHFVQYYGSTHVDAALLLLPQVGFCAPDDPRMLGTVAEIERQLMHEGFVMRYRSDDGVGGGENPFLACSLWLVEQYAMTGRLDDAHRQMDLVDGAANEVGLLSEEFDPVARRQTGNLPQAFSHLAFVRAADALAGHGGRGVHRR